MELLGDGTVLNWEETARVSKSLEEDLSESRESKVTPGQGKNRQEGKLG